MAKKKTAEDFSTIALDAGIQSILEQRKAQRKGVDTTAPVENVPQVATESVSPEQFGQIGKIFAPTIVPKQVTQLLPEKIRTPLDIGQEKFQQLAGRSAVTGASTAAFGVPAALAKKVGVDITPKSQSTEEFAADVIGNIAGVVKGGPGGVFRKVRGAAVGKRLAEPVADFLAGGTTGFLFTKKDAFSNSFGKQVADRAINAGLSATFSVGAGFIFRGVRDFSRMVSKTKQVKFLKNIRETLLGSRKKAGEVFGKEMDKLQSSKPNSKVDIRGPVRDTILIEPKGKTANIKLRNATGRSKTLQRTIASNKDQLTLRESQNIINELDDTLPQRVHRGDVSQDEREILNLINSIRSAQDAQFTGMPAVRADFRAIVDPFNQIKGFTVKGEVGAGVTATKGQIGTTGGTFGKDTEFLVEELPKLMPQSMINQLGGIRSFANVMSSVSKVLGGMIIGGAAGVAARPFLGGGDGGGDVPTEAK